LNFRIRFVNFAFAALPAGCARRRDAAARKIDAVGLFRQCGGFVPPKVASDGVAARGSPRG